MIVRGVIGSTNLRDDLVIDGLEVLSRIHLMLMPDLKDALVFEGHLLRIMGCIIVRGFVGVLTHLITIVCGIQLVVVGTLKILLLRYLILIVLNIPGLVIDGILGHQGIVRDHAPVSLVKLLDSLFLLLLLLLLHLKHL